MEINAYLALGSNLGDRLKFIQSAEQALAVHPQIELIKSSQVYETEPMDIEHEDGDQWFLNQVIEIKTDLDPHELHQATQQIEKDMGRLPNERDGVKEIDIDILTYGNELIDTPELTIPHAAMAGRRFVLVPLLEIAPDLKDPYTKKPFHDLLAELPSDHKVVPYV